MEANKFLIEE